VSLGTDIARVFVFLRKSILFEEGLKRIELVQKILSLNLSGLIPTRVIDIQIVDLNVRAPH
jgi:hypothetical protein